MMVMADKTLEQLKAEYAAIQECQRDMRKAGASANDPAFKETANRLGSLSRQIDKAEKRR
jgi:type II secretory pathway component PulM